MRASLEQQRRSFMAEGPPSVAVRHNRIDRLLALVLDNTDGFVDAMAADYGTRSRAASLFTEVVGMISVIEHTRSHVAKWMRPTKLIRATQLCGLRAEVQPCPLGVVGIIGPWNFPLNLVVLPASAAFAAGNRVMIKMSEITSHTAELMKSTAPNYFDPTELDVVTGGPDIAAAFASLPFDHLFFTGSPSVGALVQQAAAQNLVPVTLELGGKNPVVVAPNANIGRSAARIARARMVNGGQVCVCPDYVFVPDDKMEEFVAVARQTLRGMFPNIVTNDDYCSSVNQTNFERVVGLIEDARVKGATVETVAPEAESLPDRASRKVAPTIVRDIDDRMKIADEEIFGPVLAVKGYSQLADAVDYINQRPAPLVAYWYGPDDDDFRAFVRNTRSGGVARNDFAAQMIPSAAPFGGVGRSGMGAYHGKAGFDTFSHYRTVVGNDLPFSITGTAAPPFRKPLRLGANAALRVARMRVHHRLKAASRR
ncbi:aldehyde dehydrogenase family protein [Mycobacterium noviomagense]|uniref:Aldehyde dehydrogenase n=1 Tax=Mycobacterium noviomagense TaxID=459858 RepID=A0A7I7P8W6_9MYCO|nr:aldehyde dehydrogenase family protein [Mycobacterium noviomagense]ORB18839.1 coniferyl aldehyde dehydrogenase [Mycobacterium noviomagense]BBY04968.1 aldehyde dehydrogenase [Mycobacterium noviomagense]